MGRSRLDRMAAALMIFVVTLVTGCESMHESKDFERHRYSQLSEPRDRDDVVYFDVRFDVNYPADDPVAEQIRMEWLEAWLKQRKMCADGYKVEARRSFDPMEYNPGLFDRRYEISCTLSADRG